MRATSARVSSDAEQYVHSLPAGQAGGGAA
jgi:hypothetical protein